jgi:hypothetical protein
MYEDYKPLASWMKTYDSNDNYGFFGYKGYGIETSIRNDDPAAIQEAHKRGWIAPDTVTLTNTPLRTHAERKGALKVAAALGAIGYPE